MDKPMKQYMGGSKTYQGYVDPNLISLPVVWKLLKQFRYVDYKGCYFLILSRSLDKGLRNLTIDCDCLKLVKVVSGHEEIELFIEHIVN